MDPSFPDARFVAVEDGRILGVGNSLGELSVWLDGYEHRVDTLFRDKVLMPGLIDPHLHPLLGAVLLPTEFITPEDWVLPTGPVEGVRTLEAYRSRLVERIAAAPKDKPFITWGYHELWHGGLDRDALDEIDSERIVIVWQRSFHEIIVNSAAMAFLGFDTEEGLAKALDTPGVDPLHADFTAGRFSETALAIALPRLQSTILAPSHLNKGMNMLKQMLRSNGVTTIADMATGIFAPYQIEAGLIRQTFERDDSPVRVLLVPNVKPMIASMGSAEGVAEFLYEEQAKQQGHRVFLNNRIKLLADGAFFAQYMRLNPPGYSDGHEGKWLTEPDELEELARVFWNAGFEIHCHVNGDEGLDVVLNTLETLQRETPRRGHRFTLEHLGYSTSTQARRIEALGALVSAQPNYIYVLSDKYAKHGMGYDRASRMVLLGTLERQDTVVALHSDLTMAPAAPLFLAWIAANRINMEGDVMAPSEKLSLDAAIRAITIDAAYVIGLEHEVGSIVSRKRADFAVLEEDPYEVGAIGLKDISVWGVVFEGEVYPA
ncbi:MAG: amidohydrolase, partial [Candidatus Hydrogenedentota bacterium]